MSAADEGSASTRREFLRRSGRGAGLLGVGGVIGLLSRRGRADQTVWQIDPDRCNQCGNCATYCVLQPSAVKCVHAFAMCGYCQPCFGYFESEDEHHNTGAENQLCPTGAIRREFIEGQWFEYTIDEELCVGCGKCVKGCLERGNGSLFLQVRHDRCVNCNECAIAAACPADAFRRVPVGVAYLLPSGHPDRPAGKDPRR